MDAIHDTFALLWARMLQAVCIVAQQMLVDAGRTADGSKRYKRLVGMKHRGNIHQMIIKLVISINEPLRNIITIFQHSVNVETKGLWNLTKEFIIGLGCQNNCTRNVLTKRSTEILVAPCNIHSYLFHFFKIIMFVCRKAGAVISTLSVSKCC